MKSIILVLFVLATLAHTARAQQEHDESEVFVERAGKRIGIYGGTFDPPHEGHRAAVVAAIEQQHLDEVIVIVSESTERKAEKLSLKVRTRLTELTLGSVKQVRFMTAKELQEMRRLGGSAGFIDAFAKAHPETSVFPIVGTDVFEKIEKRPTNIRKKKTLHYIGNSRDGLPIADFGPVKGVTVYPKESTSSTDVRRDLAAGITPPGMSEKVFKEVKSKGYHLEKPQSCADIWSALLDAAK